MRARKRRAVESMKIAAALAALGLALLTGCAPDVYKRQVQL